MISKIIGWWIAAGGLSLTALAQNAPLQRAPIPSDLRELVTGQTEVVDTPDSRAAVLQLLSRAKRNYALRRSGQGYDLKVTFTVQSGGQTEYDGAWEMEEMFDPKLGLRWTAKIGDAYNITQIASNKTLYGEGTADYIPLRLQEARAALFGAIPPLGNMTRDLIRTSTTILNGAPVTCVLRSGSANAATATPGRRWGETEECIDPQSGLLQVHSQVPGRYFIYDYTDAPQLAGHVLPRKVTVTEAGKVVSEISVVSLSELTNADPSLFVPTEEMKARGPAIAMAAAQKISRVSKFGSIPSGAAQQVCVFGLVTPAGELVEAHSLQPDNPNSLAAVEAAKQEILSHPRTLGTHPQQHFVFFIEKFVSSP